MYVSYSYRAWGGCRLTITIITISIVIVILVIVVGIRECSVRGAREPACFERPQPDQVSPRGNPRVEAQGPQVTLLVRYYSRSGLLPATVGLRKLQDHSTVVDHVEEGETPHVENV